MLESLINFREVNSRPWLAFFWAFVICSVAVVMSYQISTLIYVQNIALDLAGLYAIIFILVPSAYFMVMLIKKEEMLEEGYIRKHYEKAFWERHKTDILIFLFYFFGLTVAFSIWSVVLPTAFFDVQVSTICTMHPSLGVCDTLGLTGGLTQETARFYQYFSNNIQVFIFSFLFSLIFGAGSIFIIIWNASILGVYIGLKAQSLYMIPVTSFPFLPHGIPEIAGYIAAGLAGSLISAAFIRKADADIIKKISFDAMKILMVGAALILLGAAIEAYL